MANNPFLPSEIASRPEMFFGRKKEISKLERTIQNRSITIQGPIGIGKSSLLSRILLHMEGFESNHNSKYIVATAHDGVRSVDDAAKLLLEKVISADENNKSLTVSLFKVLTIKESEVYKNFTDGRHLSVFTRILQKDYLERLLNGGEFLIIAIDEVDKSPSHIARLIRVISNELQQQGINNVRFVVAGVNPYFKSMATTDPGIIRFFAPPLNVTQLTHEESAELIHTKLCEYKNESESSGHEVQFSPEIIEAIQRLSGGHPHLIQLLGWHLIENEEENPDGILDIKDLTNALRAICYEERVYIYDEMIHQLQIEGLYDKFIKIVTSCENALPTTIPIETIGRICNKDDLTWFVDNNYLSPLPSEEFGMVDEFLRVRVLMDAEKNHDGDIERSFLLSEKHTLLDFDSEESFSDRETIKFDDDNYEHTNSFDPDGFFDDYYSEDDDEY